MLSTLVAICLTRDGVAGGAAGAALAEAAAAVAEAALGRDAPLAAALAGRWLPVFAACMVESRFGGCVRGGFVGEE